MKITTKLIIPTLALLASMACMAKVYEAPVVKDYHKITEIVTSFCFEGVLYISNKNGMTHAVDRAGKPLQCKEPK